MPINISNSSYIAKPCKHIIIRNDPIDCKRDANGWFIDFGRAAFATLWIRGIAQKPTKLMIHLGEKLNANGQIERKPEGCIRYRQIIMTIDPGKTGLRVQIPADERNTGPCAVSMPDDLFEVLPFRYAEIEVACGEFSLEQVQQHAVQYPFNEDAASFVCSDSRLNQVWELCRYSIMATSFAPVYVDGDRERISYEGDAYINQLGHYCLDRDYQLARRTIEHLLFHPTWPTEWQLHCVPMAWQDFMYSGDDSLLRTYYADLKAKTLLPLAREDGLISTCGSVPQELLDSIHLAEPLRDLVDWPPGSFTEGGIGERDNHDMRPINTVVNAFHYWNLVLFSEIARITEHVEDADFCVKRARLVASSMHKLYSNEQGAYLDGEGSEHCSQHSSMFAAAFGLVKETQRTKVMDFLISKGMACSVYGAQFLLEACFRLGCPDHALALMCADHNRSWLNMINTGSTITLEAWDWKYKNNLDWNHAWGAAPANIIPRFLAGVRPLSEGFRTISVAPAPGRLESFQARVPLNEGAVNMDYTSDGDSCKLAIHMDTAGNKKMALDLSALPFNNKEISIMGIPQKNINVISKEKVYFKN